MASSNFEKMIALATETFAANNDPDQLDVNEEVIKQLENLHPSTLSQHIEGDGPVVWILLIPTSSALMNQFINAEISESELLRKTSPGDSYEALYLCSALVLPEYRRRGLALKLTLGAIRKIRDDHPIKNLFSWNFSYEGALLAENIAREENLPLLKRPRSIKGL